ncbi:MAG TPA: aquaporin [Saprospiraceae bacterium]|nr:aquaporin [Saprospiraceae bacterium]
MRKYLAEGIGTFALVFFGTGAIVVNQEINGIITNLGIAIIFGLIVMVMIYSLGDISGAHLNPGVTIGFCFSGKFPLKEVLPYVVSELSGAIFASIVLKLLFPDNTVLGCTIPSGNVIQSFIVEFLLSFFLMFVILNVAHGSKEKGMFAGIAIGATVLIEAIFAGPISGASMNPARSMGPAIITFHFQYLWIYILAPVLGVLIAVRI